MSNPIVGIGELLWDVYPDGRKVAGGAPFNFAFHCHQLGHPAVIVSRVGDDVSAAIPSASRGSPLRCAAAAAAA